MKKFATQKAIDDAEDEIEDSDDAMSSIEYNSEDDEPAGQLEV